MSTFKYHIAPKSTGGYDGGDWGNHSALDFDGWRFLSFPLPNESRLKHLEPGSGFKQLRGRIDGRLDHPLKLTAIHIITQRQSLDLTQMKPVRSPLRFKDVRVFGGSSD